MLEYKNKSIGVNLAKRLGKIENDMQISYSLGRSSRISRTNKYGTVDYDLLLGTVGTVVVRHIGNADYKEMEISIMTLNMSVMEATTAIYTGACLEAIAIGVVHKYAKDGWGAPRAALRRIAILTNNKYGLFSR